MAIRKIKAETVNRNRNKWYLTFSLDRAKRLAGTKTIYRLPNGVYAVRK